MLGHSINQYRLSKTLRKIAELKAALKDIETLPHAKISGLVRPETGNGESWERPGVFCGGIASNRINATPTK